MHAEVSIYELVERKKHISEVIEKDQSFTNVSLLIV